LRVLAVSEDCRNLDDLRKLSSGFEPITDLVCHTGSLSGLSALPVKGEVDVLILDCRHGGMASLAEFERLALLYPRLNTILVVDQESPELLLRALRLGVREVLKAPLAEEDVQAAFRRIQKKGGTGGRGDGRVLAFMSCKGGSGATFLSTNFGYVLASHTGKRVLLIDLNLQFGDAVLYVSDSRPTISLIDVVRDIRRMDLSLLTSAMVEIRPNFGVISAPEDPTQSVDIRPSHIESVIRLARSHFDYVLLDVGRSLDTCTIKALDLADHIYPVLQLTLPFLRDAKRLFDVYRSLDYSAGKVQPILNRVERAPVGLTEEDADELLFYKVFATVPNHFKSATASVNQGIPILKLDGASPIARSLQDLADRITESPQARTSQGFISRLFARA
jgi:pilus assembly protein CpaE